MVKHEIYEFRVTSHDDIKSVVEMLKKAVRLKPKYAEAHLLLGRGYVNLGYLKSARSELAVLKQLNKQMASGLSAIIRDRNSGIPPGIPGGVPGGIPGGLIGSMPPMPVREGASPDEIAASLRVSKIRQCLEGK